MTAVQVNGEARELATGATLAEVVREAGGPDDGRGVAAAVDGEVVPRGDWPVTQLREGQRVEVLHAVQGG